MFVQPSGLIFLVIIAIWAAYLLQHWVRRREHLATARSVDRFSDAMRVLERRTLLPESDLSVPQPRSYSVSPARPSRSEVVVKRAQSPTPHVPSVPAAGVRSTRAFHALARMSARRVRGLSLLTSLAFALVASPLAAFGVVPWWIIVVAVGVLVVDVAWLRHRASRDRAARRARVRSATVFAGVATDVSRPAGQVDSLTSGAGGDVSGDTSEVALEGRSPAESAAQAVAERDPSGWAPIPVPPPTYTLKAKAHRPEPAPAAVTEPTSIPGSSFDGLVDEGELDGLLDRRHATGA